MSYFISLIFTATAVLAQQAPSAAPPSEFEKACKELQAKRTKTAEEKLAAIYDLQWKYEIETYPGSATYHGEDVGQDRLLDLSPAAIALRKREARCSLEMIRSVDRAALKSDAARLDHDLFLYDAQITVDWQKFPREYLAIGSMGGVHRSIVEILDEMRKQRKKDYEDRIARLKAMPKLIEQNIALLQEGLKLGITPPRATIEKIPAQVDTLAKTPLAKHPLLESFRDMPASISEEDKKTLRAQAEKIVASEVIPAIAKLHAFLAKTYVPGARQTLALTALPDGQAWYALAVRSHTTTPLTPKEIHELGLKETERIGALLDKQMKATGWKKSRKEFFEYLRNDPKFSYKKPGELLEGYREISKRIDPELPRMFGKLPRLPYGVKPIPDFAAKTSATAYYYPGSLQSGRPGWFVANTDNLKARPKWEMEVLTAHEAVPGHHLQIAIAQEIENVPKYRKNFDFTAFVEGWGLYSESLGEELGLYKDPYSKVGAISFEMWRAARLVVDTGLHAFGWSREQAIEFMAERAPKPRHDIENEVDRYITMPGQALGYKIGQLKFLHLREKARAELGDRFDIREYHDVVLRDGSVPLDVLSARVEEWISARRTLR